MIGVLEESREEDAVAVAVSDEGKKGKESRGTMALFMFAFEGASWPMLLLLFVSRLCSGNVRLECASSSLTAACLPRLDIDVLVPVLFLERQR